MSPPRNERSHAKKTNVPGLQRPDCLPGDNRARGAAFQFPTVERIIAAARKALLFVDAPFAVRIDERDVGHGAFAERAAFSSSLGVEAEQPRGIDRVKLDEAREIDGLPLVHE